MILAGGTGGHIFPGLAVARALIEREVAVSWLGTPGGLENRLVPAAGIALERVRISGLRGRGLGGWLAAPFRILAAMVQSRRVLKRHRPGCVLSMGGYAAGPGGLMARLMGIPLVIHEQNAVAGWTNRLLAPLASRICTGFPGTLKNAVHTGNPVRAEIVGLDEPARRYAGRQGPLRLLIIGGSQGAQVFNRVVPAALARLPEARRPEVLHQAGRSRAEAEAAYRKAGVAARVVEFVEDMAAAWGQADVAVCRAGALTVAELAAAGVPAVLVPFPFAVDDHQAANARFLAEADAGWMVRQQEFTPEWLADRLIGLERAELAAVAARARSLARPGAAAEVASACLEVMA